MCQSVRIYIADSRAVFMCIYRSFTYAVQFLSYVREGKRRKEGKWNYILCVPFFRIGCLFIMLIDFCVQIIKQEAHLSDNQQNAR